MNIKQIALVGALSAATVGTAALTSACVFRRAATAGMRISWSDNMNGTAGRIGGTFVFTCPPSSSAGNVWGTDIYSDDSSICTAGVHAGVIGWNGGVVRIVLQPGQASYMPSARNGVVSQPWGSWNRSFSFVP